MTLLSLLSAAGEGSRELGEAMAELGRVHGEMAFLSVMPRLCGAAQARMRTAILKRRERELKQIITALPTPTPGAEERG